MLREADQRPASRQADGAAAARGRDPKEVLRDLFDCFNRSQWEDVLDHLAEHVEWFPTSSLVDGRVYRGKSDVAEWIFGLVARAGHCRIDVVADAMERHGDRVLVVALPALAGRQHPRGGVPSVMFFVATVRDGLIASLHAHPGQASAGRELHGEPWSAPALAQE